MVTHSMLVSNIVSPHASVPVGLDPTSELTDPRRVAAVEGIGFEPAACFDHLAGVAAAALGTDRALVSMITATHQVVIGAHGVTPLPAPEPQALTICAYTIALGEPLLIGELITDPVLASAPIAGSALSAYAGVVLRVDGERVGTLCVTSERGRAWTIGDAERLTSLGALGSHLLERRGA